MDEIVDAFNLGSAGTDDDLVYSFWEKSGIQQLPLNTVPLSLNDDKKSSAMKQSKLGDENFDPWFVADANPGPINDYFKVVMEILEQHRKRRVLVFQRGC